MKLKLMGVSSTDIKIEVKFRITGDNMVSEEIKEFLQKHTADNIGVDGEGDMYTFSLPPSSESVTESVSKIEYVLDELIKEDSERYYTMFRHEDDIVARKLLFWLSGKFANGEIRG